MVREKQYLQWRYFAQPSKNTRFFSIREQNGRLVSYTTFGMRRKSGTSLKLIEMLDAFFDHHNHGLVCAALKQIVSEAQKLDADIIMVRFIPVYFRNFLRKLGFYYHQTGIQPCPL